MASLARRSHCCSSCRSPARCPPRRHRPARATTSNRSKPDESTFTPDSRYASAFLTEKRISTAIDAQPRCHATFSIRVAGRRLRMAAMAAISRIIRRITEEEAVGKAGAAFDDLQLLHRSFLYSAIWIQLR